jgi:hypothetical protein
MGDSRLATPKTRSRKANAGPRRGILIWFAVIAVAGLALWAVFGNAALGYARAGSAYSARVACSCVYIAGRSLDDCAKDKIAGMELIRLSKDAEAKSVTARFPLLASDTASFRKGYGCVLQRWEH